MEREGQLDIESEDGIRINSASVIIRKNLLSITEKIEQVDIRMNLPDCHLVKPSSNSSLLIQIQNKFPVYKGKAEKSNSSNVVLYFANFAEADAWISALLNAIGCCLFSKDESSWPYGWKHRILRKTVWSAAVLDDEKELTQVLSQYSTAEFGLAISQQDEEGITPLHLAASLGHVSLVETLLSLGSAVDLKDVSGNTALHKAAIKGSADIIEAICKKISPEGVNAVNSAGETAHCIVEVSAMTPDDKSTALKYLLCAKADPLLFYFYRALLREMEEDAEEVLKRGVSISYRLLDGRTSLVISVEKNLLSVTESLLRLGANPNNRDKSRKTPLHYAATMKDAEILILYGSRPDLEDKHGRKAINGRFSDEELQYLERARQSYLKFSSITVNANSIPSSIELNWINDDSKDECMLCSSSFGFVIRRHHCRICGALLCTDCCSKKVIVKPSSTPCKCCDCCFNILRPFNTL